MYNLLLRSARAAHREHIAQSRARHDEPKGSSWEEIDKLERTLGFALPLAYREYLLWMGDDSGFVFRGSHCQLRHVIENTAELPALLEENGIPFQRPERLVCRFMHQGYIASWFDAAPGVDDPDVFWFGEGDPEKTGIQADGRFSESLREAIKDAGGRPNKAL